MSLQARKLEQRVKALEEKVAALEAAATKTATKKGAKK